MAGLEDNEVKDRNLMKQLSVYTKLEPQERILKTNQFLNLLKEEKKDWKKIENILSSKEKSEKYGIEVVEFKESFKAYTMNEPNLIGGNNSFYIDNEKDLHKLYNDSDSAINNWKYYKLF